MRRTAGVSQLIPVLMSMSLSGSLGCQSEGAKPAKDAGVPISTGGSGGLTTGASGGASGGAGATGNDPAGGRTGSGGSGGSTSMCYVDSPCQFSFQCASSNSYQAYVTNWDCHSICGPGPCSGASCVPSGSPVACPAGSRCVGGGFNDITMGCQAIRDAGTADGQVKDPVDAPASDAGSIDAQLADRGSRLPADVLSPDAAGSEVPLNSPVDAAGPDVVAVCKPGEQRCRDLIVQTCSTAGQWKDTLACPYVCSDGACIGECIPGYRRRCSASKDVPQTCSSAGAWVDEPACSGSTPYCATGQCVASCLSAGQDCTDPQTACCAGTECVSTTSDQTFACKAISSCGALGSSCTASTDCCAGLDCTASKCAAKVQSCLDMPEDGVCDGTSGAGCCPGTECTRQFTTDPFGCKLPSTTKPQEGGCPREQPAHHETCRASKLGLNCGYSDWTKANGIYYYCTCSYHGWSCTQGHYVR
jgi:hypothetical protein